MLLEPQCTGPITSSRHPLCLEIVYFVLKTTQDHLLWSQVYGKIRPHKTQFCSGFFSVSYFILGHPVLRWGVDRQRHNGHCLFFKAIIMWNIVIDIIMEERVLLVYDGKDFTFYSLIYSISEGQLKQSYLQLVALRLKSSFAKERDPRSNGLYLDYQL